MKKVAFVLGLVAPILAFAQIQITSSDIPSDTGTKWWMDYNSSVTVNVGTAGASKIWDFTSQAVGNDSGLNTIIDKNNAPFKDSLPAANYVLITKNYPAGDSNCTYSKLVSDSFNLMGETIDTMGSGLQLIRLAPPIYTKLPITYGNQWAANSNGQFKVIMGGFPVTIAVNMKTHCQIDGYGQVKIPYGNFDCLRLLEYDTLIFSAMGMMDTMATIAYKFWAKNYGIVATVTSADGETNPNFTTGNLNRMTQFHTAIEERTSPKQKIVNLYPNPFRNNIDIKYSLANSGNVSLKIYDITGNLVRTLVDNSQSVGNHNMLWNGNNTNGTKVPAGIYFYELKTPTDKLMNKIILLK
ncbi:MAG: FlgD immunoglobulin-like domain containing protein [bacterium]|nr:FlgD immunoglobulin-like domain containing protein [bacterium]